MPSNTLPVSVEGLRTLGREIFARAAQPSGATGHAPDLRGYAASRMPEVFGAQSEAGDRISTALGQVLNHMQKTLSSSTDVKAWVEEGTEAWLVHAVEWLHAGRFAISGGTDLLAQKVPPVEVMTTQKGPGRLDARTDRVSDPDGGPMRQLRVRSTGAGLEILIRRVGATEFEEVGTIPAALRSALIQLLEKAGRSEP